MPFDKLIPSLQAKNIDPAISGMTITVERSQTVNFARPYFQSGLAIAVRKEDKGKIKSFDDLENKKIAVAIGTTGAQEAQKIAGSEIFTFDNSALALQELSNANVDAVVNLLLIGAIVYGVVLSDGDRPQATPQNIYQDDLGQVTNVNQLRDVAPTDWAYEALRCLVDRYGCIAGFPNQTYRGNQQEGSAAIVSFGQSSTLIDSEGNAVLDDPNTPYLLNIEYQYNFSDNIQFTPGAYALFNPDGDSENDTIYVGTLRTIFRF